MKKAKILLVEDDPNFGTILTSYLELADYDVTLQTDGKKGLAAFRRERFDLLILDIMMPEMDGFTLASEIRKTDEDIPFIFLTAKTLKEDILEGFKIGADDFLIKPFDSEVLLYKLAAILKRKGVRQNEEEAVLTIGKFSFDTRLRTLTINDSVTSLSPKEAGLLKLLAQSKDGILPRREALLKIWGNEDYFTTRSMDVFMARLRKYLKTDPAVEIQNIHGNGFRLLIKNH